MSTIERGDGRAARRGQARADTVEMLRAFALQQPLTLFAPARNARFELVAADQFGGLLRCLDRQAREVANHKILSLRDPTGRSGPVRLIALTRTTVERDELAAGRLVVVSWVALTALEHGSHLANLLEVLGVKAHLGPGSGALDPRHELIYEPASQRVRLITVPPEEGRAPTAQLRDVGSLPEAPGPAGVLVETHPVSPTVDWDRFAAPRARESGRRRLTPSGGAGYRGKTPRPDEEVGAAPQVGAPPEPWPELERPLPTEPPGDPEPSEPRARSARRVPARRQFSLDHPEFSCGAGVSGLLEAQSRAYAAVITSVGQGSCTVEVAGGVQVGLGEEVKIGIPAHPVAEGYVWLGSYVERSAGMGDGMLQLRLRHDLRKVPQLYRRVVQLWARRARGGVTARRSRGKRARRAGAR